MKDSATKAAPPQWPEAPSTPCRQKCSARNLPTYSATQLYQTYRSRHCISVRGRYIVSPSRSGLMVIDQHRAHLRVLFDQFMEMSSEASFATQRMMFPEIVRLSPAQAAVLESLLPEVSAIGFDLSPLGDGDWSLNGARQCWATSIPSTLCYASSRMKPKAATNPPTHCDNGWRCRWPRQPQSDRANS